MNPWQAITYWYKKVFHRNLKITFLSAFVTGLLAHLFMLTNVLHNYDSITQVPGGVGTSLSSGRWLLMYIENFQNKFWATYTVPFSQGLLTILLLSVAACLVTSMFQIQDTLNCILTGAVMVCFPAVTSTMFFMYTAPHYALAILFCILAAWLADKKWYGPVLGIFLLAGSLGIYQAYLPLTAGLMVLQLIWKLLRKESGWICTVRNGIRDLVILGGGVIAYMLILNLTLKHYQIDLGSYQGINNMGKLSLTELPGLLKGIVLNFWHLTSQDYCQINATPVVQKGILLLGLLSAILATYFLFAYKRSIMDRVLAVLLFVMIPFAADSIEIMCSESDIYTLMLYGMAVIYLVPIILLELQSDEQMKVYANKFSASGFSRYLKLICTWGISICLFFINVNYIWSSNVNYTAMYYADLETQEYLASMMTRMRSVEGYTTDAPVAFIGKISDPSYDKVWGGTPVLYGGNDSTFINRYSRIRFFNHLLSYNYTEASAEQIAALKKTTEVKEMACYPNDNSIKMVDGILVVKLKNVK